ncbi:hypothetical protein HBA55_19400 [Pseudomaricurvus alkylphenolicus]|uniref:hypothetical protein n=1 Tax=Pseudomaricurvus alkylphenolicus TaxID=1306991 RepID=UPI001420DCAD|nr:hypothetical protein [Pseudomaricurvus alkylphenolicus]NIB41781.1 hypothetical protein [Pseudomaricurvus alkylphenolicus]
MKKASRFMPEYRPKKASKLALIVLLALAGGLVIYEPVMLAVVIAITLLVIRWSKFEQQKMDEYFHKLCEERKGLSICEFAREFDARAVDTWIIRATYEQLQAALPTKHVVPIKASDNLFETLKLDEEDLDLDLAEMIAQRTGRSLNDCEGNPYYGKVTTAGKLVLFFNHQAGINAT